MLTMSKKKPKPEPVDTSQEPVTQVLFRSDDDRLFATVDIVARSLRQSRNMALNILVEEALAARKLWPPPATSK